MGMESTCGNRIWEERKNGNRISVNRVKRCFMRQVSGAVLKTDVGVNSLDATNLSRYNHALQIN
jgi:hypothetical protein